MTTPLPATTLERVLLTGDLTPLSATERLAYYHKVCESLGLNSLTRPFEYLTLNGTLVLYARKDCTDQLRRLHNISVTLLSQQFHADVFLVTARATLPDGRQDEAIGCVSLGGLRGDALSNAVMRAQTKATRRATLGLCGVSLTDESEVAAIPGATPWQEPVSPALPAPEPQPAPVPQVAQQVDPQAGITQPQRKRLFAIARNAGVPDEGWRAYMVAVHGTDSTRQLTQTAYEALCADLEHGDIAQWLEERTAIAEMEQTAA
jgi:hypothetical protein